MLLHVLSLFSQIQILEAITMLCCIYNQKLYKTMQLMIWNS